MFIYRRLLILLTTLVEQRESAMNGSVRGALTFV